MDILIKNLPFQVNTESLEVFLGRFGRILDLTVRRNKNALSFAYVKMQNSKKGISLIKKINGQSLDGYILVVQDIPIHKKGSKQKINGLKNKRLKN